MVYYYIQLLFTKLPLTVVCCTFVVRVRKNLLIMVIDGHGGWVMGVHPLMKTKNWPKPGVKKTVRG